MIGEIESTLKDHGFTVESIIGEGSFARVFTVQWDQYPGKLFVAKVIAAQNKDMEIKTSSYISEIEALKRLSHPNVIYFFDYFQVGNKFYIILEYCRHGSIFQQILKHGPFASQHFKIMARECLNALAICHQNDIVHLDIKPENILLGDFYLVKLCDFGLASIIDKSNPDKKIQNLGSVRYCAPERFISHPFDPKKADVWSLGITFYFFATGKLPWHATDVQGQIDEIMKGQIEFPEHIDSNISGLIRSMCIVDPQKRASLDSISKIEYFKLRTSSSDSHIRNAGSKISRMRQPSIKPQMLKPILIHPHPVHKKKLLSLSLTPKQNGTTSKTDPSLADIYT